MRPSALLTLALALCTVTLCTVACDGPPPGSELDAGDTRTDASVALDAGEDGGADASLAPDAGSDAGAPPGTYVVSAIDLPVTAVVSMRTGVDLDGDGTIDNALGGMLGAVDPAFGLGALAAMDEHIDRGEAIVLIEVRASSLVADEAAQARVLGGRDPIPSACDGPDDVVCEGHLDGLGYFTAVRPAPELVGATILAGRLEGAPGTAMLPLTFGGDVFWVPLTSARLRGDFGDTIFHGGSLSGAIAQADVDGTIIPAFHARITAIIAGDCTPECLAGSAGETLLSVFDADDDGSVTLAELRADARVISSFALDLDLDGDGAMDAMSAGIGVTAVGASFIAP